MRDSLKEHIDANSEDFEIYPYEASDWNKIADKLDPPKRRYRGLYFGVAASLAVIFITSVLMMSSNTGPIDEVAEMEGYYEEAISYKVSLVKDQLSDPSVLDHLEAMDEAFAELKADLNENVDNEEVIMAMMENYQLKLKILEEILSELEKEKDEKPQ